MYLTTDLPAGNAVLVDQHDETFVIRPDLRGNREWWFYWHIAIRGAAGRTIRLELPERRCVGALGPAVSHDRGTTWFWHGDPDDPQRITIVVPEHCDDLRLSCTMPYTGIELAAATAELPDLRRDSLCTSHGGREVPLLRCGAEPAKAEGLIVLTARHHCCESMASYALDGALRAICTDDTLAPLRERLAVIAVPFVDCDGVEQGDQGKFRAPHDHNRDYQDGRYAETVALRRLLDDPLLATLPCANLDLHCPYILGTHDKTIYIVGSGEAQRAEEQQRFATLLAGQGEQALGFDADDILPHGQAWNTMPIEPRRNCCRWFAGRPSCRLSTTFEIPYGPSRAGAIDQASARAFGTALARTLQAFMLG